MCGVIYAIPYAYIYWNTCRNQRKSIHHCHIMYSLLFATIIKKEKQFVRLLVCTFPFHTVLNWVGCMNVASFGSFANNLQGWSNKSMSELVFPFFCNFEHETIATSFLQLYLNSLLCPMANEDHRAQTHTHAHIFVAMEEYDFCLTYVTPIGWTLNTSYSQQFSILSAHNSVCMKYRRCERSHHLYVVLCADARHAFSLD